MTLPGTGGRDGETITPSGSLQDSGRVAGVRGRVAAGIGGSPARQPWRWRSAGLKKESWTSGPYLLCSTKQKTQLIKLWMIVERMIIRMQHAAYAAKSRWRGDLGLSERDQADPSVGDWKR